MIAKTGDDWLASERKSVALIGMSGVGKTHISAMLRESGDWFHYSADYRIGTRYLNEEIQDDFKREAMKNDYLRNLLLSNSIYIGSNLTFHNLAPLSTWLGKPGDPAKGGIAFQEYMRRQRLHREAEIRSMTDCPRFISRARQLYGYSSFICDTSGSFCEVADGDNPDDPVMTAISEHMLPVYIRGTDAHEEALKERFSRAPKPMYYQEDFLTSVWRDYLGETGETEAEADPDAFIRYGYAKLLKHRGPRYQSIADNWGVTVEAGEVADLRSQDDFNALIARAIDRKSAQDTGKE